MDWLVCPLFGVVFVLHFCHSTEQGSGNWLTFADEYGVERLDVATNVTETVIGGIGNAVALDIHYEKGYVYWSDFQSKKISRTSVTNYLVSGIVEDVITSSVDTPDGIAIDWIYDLLYWTDSGRKHIQVSRLDGRYRRTIVKDKSLDNPSAIAVDPNTGWLFFSDLGVRPRIERCTMDGRDRRVIVDTDIVLPYGMTIDLIGQRLYWIDGGLNQIKSTRFDGNETYTVIKNSDVKPKPFDLVVFNNYIYWYFGKHRSICRVNTYTGKDFEIVANFIRKPMGIQMFGVGAQIKGQNLCGQNNGGCSHICFPLPAHNTTKSTLPSCMCPDYYDMHTDQTTCISNHRANLWNLMESSIAGESVLIVIVVVIVIVIVLIVIVVIVVIIFVCRRLRKTKKLEQHLQGTENPRFSINIINDNITDDINTTTYLPMSAINNSLNVTLKLSYKHPQRSEGTHEMENIETDSYLTPEVNRGSITDSSLLANSSFNSSQNPNLPNSCPGLVNSDRDTYLSPV